MRVSEGLGRGPMVEKVKVSPPSSRCWDAGCWPQFQVSPPEGAAAGTELTSLRIS